MQNLLTWARALTQCDHLATRPIVVTSTIDNRTIEKRLGWCVDCGSLVTDYMQPSERIEDEPSRLVHLRTVLQAPEYAANDTTPATRWTPSDEHTREARTWRELSQIEQAEISRSHPGWNANALARARWTKKPGEMTFPPPAPVREDDRTPAAVAIDAIGALERGDAVHLRLTKNARGVVACGVLTPKDARAGDVFGADASNLLAELATLAIPRGAAR